MTSTIVTKFCSGCKSDLPETDFSFKDKRHTARQHRCKSCTRKYAKTHYKQNKDAYLARNRRARKTNRAKVADLKKNPCSDCGQMFPTYVMEFDHRDPENKDFSIGRSPFYGWYSRIVKELDKCDLVCSNCHKIRTHSRRYAADSTPQHPAP